MKWNGSDLHKLRLPPWIRAFPWACGMMLAAACLAADPEVQRLEESFAAAIKRVEQPISDLQDNYKNSLETWMAEAQQKGDLAAALAAKTEEEIRKGSTPMSTSRVIALGESLVCRVEKTR